MNTASVVRLAIAMEQTQQRWWTCENKCVLPDCSIIQTTNQLNIVRPTDYGQPNQTNTINVNIRDVSHVTMVTSAHPYWPSCTTRLTVQALR